MSRPKRDAAYFALQADVADFLYHEADLLDERRFDEWLDLLADDIVYFVPMRRNVAVGTHAEHESTREGADISWFEDDKWTLTKRVEQLATGVHWAEEPVSRTTHVVSGVQILSATPSIADPAEVTARCRFVVYQNRVEYEEYFFVGKRTDTLRRDRRRLAPLPPRGHARPERAAGEEPDRVPVSAFRRRAGAPSP